MMLKATTSKPPAYVPVDVDGHTYDHGVIVQGEIITPFWHKRKRELCISFTLGTIVGFILLALISSGHQHSRQPTVAITTYQPPSTPEGLVFNATAVKPLEPHLVPSNETATESAEGEQHGDEQPWWSKATDTVTGWFGGGKHETKSAGGGRDWLVNAQTGLLSAKQDPTFMLSVGPAPLILVPQESPEKLVFLQVASDTMQLIAQGSEQGSDYVGFKKLDPENVDGFEYYDLVVSPFVDPLFIRFQDGFLVYGDDYVLDIASWEVVANKKVNLIKSLKDNSTFTPGGGRDWVVNDDGSVSPMLNLGLALGKGSRGLVITQETDQALHLMHSKELANGDTVPMELRDELYVVGVKEARTVDGWRYSDTVLLNDKPIRVKYDGNFITTPREDFALDIANWKMDEGNTVNFVGGDK